MSTFDDVYNHIMTCDVGDILLYGNRPCADTIWINIFYVGDSGELIVRYDRYMFIFKGFNTNGISQFRDLYERLNRSQEIHIRLEDIRRLLSL